MSESMINVGASKEAISEARVTVAMILDCEASDQVKLTALKTLTKICAVRGTTISNCTLTNTKP